MTDLCRRYGIVEHTRVSRVLSAIGLDFKSSSFLSHSRTGPSLRFILSASVTVVYECFVDTNIPIRPTLL